MIDLSHKCTNDPNPTALSDVKCIFFITGYLCMRVAGFGVIFDWYLSMSGRLFFVPLSGRRHVTNHANDRFLDFHADLLVTFYVFMCVHIVALIL